MMNYLPGFEPEPSHYTPVAPKVYDPTDWTLDGSLPDFSNIIQLVPERTSGAYAVCDLENPEVCEACQ